MVVIADSSPLHYLILIDQVDVLPALFGQVIIPDEVLRELTHASTPSEVRQAIQSYPAWLVVKTPTSIEHISTVDPGESAAISLALELNADLLLIDDLDGRAAAMERKLKIIGTIGVLELAAARKLIDLSDAFARIRKTRFRVSDALLAQALKRSEDGGSTK
jgi:predicted nucleic acid-binding protein